MLTLSEFQYTNTILGEGSFGVVKKVIHHETKQVFALKTIPRSLLKESEIEIHQRLDHPNILKLHTFFEDSMNVYLVLEYAEKGSLFHKTCKGPLSEKESWNYFVQICCGIRYMHDRGFIHRDLKPENILISADNIVKISDFGWSARSNEIRKSVCGTMDFMAPEILHRAGYSYEVDLWALGALLYELRHGYAPFQEYTGPWKIHNICDGNYCIRNNLAKEEKDLISKLLTVSRHERITLEDVFEHPWVNKFSNKGFTGRIHDHPRARGKINWAKGTLCEIEFENRQAFVFCTHLASKFLKINDNCDDDPNEVLRFYKKRRERRKNRNLSIYSDYSCIVSPQLAKRSMIEEQDEVSILKALIQNNGNHGHPHKKIRKPCSSVWSKIFGCGGRE